MPDNNCRECERHRKRGHNYCRACGYKLHPSTTYASIPDAKSAGDEFCGFCGGAWNSCKCRQPRRTKG